MVSPTASLHALVGRATAIIASVRVRAKAVSSREIGPAALADKVAVGSNPADRAENAEDSRPELEK